MKASNMSLYITIASLEGRIMRRSSIDLDPLYDKYKIDMFFQEIKELENTLSIRSDTKDYNAGH